MKKLVLWGALSICGALAPALPAMAGRSTLCDATVVTDDTSINAGYKTCVTYGLGMFDAANGSAEAADLSSSFARPGQTLVLERKGLSTDNAFGPFASIVQPTSSTAGVLTFDTLQTGFFVVGLQALDPTFSITDPVTGQPVPKIVFYQFDYGLAGTLSIRFDTLGIDSSLPPLQAASLYAVAAAAVVPEPQGWALAALGLGALAFVRRRRDA